MVLRAFRKGLVAATLSLMAFSAWPASSSPPLPSEIVHDQPQLHVLGQGELTFLFWKVYDIALYVSGSDLQQDKPYALAVVYARHFTGPEIADEGVKQMRHLGYQDQKELDQWRAYMLKGFPEVEVGDRVAAVFLPPEEVQIYINDKMTAEIKDRGFSTAFFGIWLDSNTSKPKLRQALLSPANQVLTASNSRFLPYP